MAALPDRSGADAALRKDGEPMSERNRDKVKRLEHELGRYKKKQYKCKVMVKAPVKAINMKENNAVFTKTVYQKLSKIQRLVVKQEVISPKGIYEIYQLLAAMDIQEITNSSSEKFVGGISLELQFNDGTKLGFTIGKNLVIDGKQYKIAEDVSEKVGQLLKQYKS